MNTPLNIAVTGATGFVGKALVANLKPDYAISTLNLRDTDPASLDLSRVTAIVHCAALVHQMQGAPREDYFRVNTKLTEDLALAAKQQGVRHFVFLSTSHVYGEYGDCYQHSKLLRETDTCTPTDPYGESKLAAENILLRLDSPEFKVAIIRSPMVYGEGAKGNLLNLCKLIKALPALPFNETRNRRSLIYVGNLAHFIRRTLEAEARGLLLAQDEAPLSISQIVSALAANMGAKVWLFRLPGPIFSFLYYLRPNIMKRLYGTLALDSESSNAKIGYKAPVPSHEGFRRMIAAANETNAEFPQP